MTRWRQGLMVTTTFASVLVASLGHTANAPCPQISPGLILGYDGSSSDYLILRGEQRVPTRLYTELRGGDAVSVLAPKGRLVIGGADRAPIRLGPKPGRACVKPTAAASIATNFMRNLGELVGRRRDEPGGGLISRGDGDPIALAPADLAAGRAVVVAGTRPVAFAWQGGKPPFSVEFKAGEHLLAQETGLKSRILILSKPRQLTAGLQHQVAVRDAAGHSTSASFVPTLPDYIQVAGGVDAALQNASIALSLGDDHAFEALMLLSPYRRHSETARDVMDALAERGATATQK